MRLVGRASGGRALMVEAVDPAEPECALIYLDNGYPEDHAVLLDSEQVRALIVELQRLAAGRDRDPR